MIKSSYVSVLPYTFPELPMLFLSINVHNPMKYITQVPHFADGKTETSRNCDQFGKGVAWLHFQLCHFLWVPSMCHLTYFLQVMYLAKLNYFTSCLFCFKLCCCLLSYRIYSWLLYAKLFSSLFAASGTSHFEHLCNYLSLPNNFICLFQENKEIMKLLIER